MKLENQVVSLELAKKLKELGVKQESLYNWLVASDGARLMKNPVLDTYRYFEQSSAFTVAELGEMLPRKFYSERYNNGQFYCQRNDGLHNHNEYADTEADARAKMLIYLLENKLINI